MGDDFPCWRGVDLPGGEACGRQLVPSPGVCVVETSSSFTCCSYAYVCISPSRGSSGGDPAEYVVTIALLYETDYSDLPSCMTSFYLYLTFFVVPRKHARRVHTVCVARPGGQLEETAVLRRQRGAEHSVPGAGRGAGGVALKTLVQRISVGDAQLYAARLVLNTVYSSQGAGGYSLPSTRSCASFCTLVRCHTLLYFPAETKKIRHTLPRKAAPQHDNTTRSTTPSVSPLFS